jgi:hypothetical protein
MTSPAAKPHGAWATGPYEITSRDPLGSLGSKERKLEGGGRRGEVDAGVGTATSARRRYSAGGAGALSGEEARERACEGVRLGACTRRENNTS